MFGRLGLVAAVTTLLGCASSSDEISSTYVSPLEYEFYTCKQLAREAQRVADRAAMLAGRIDDNARDDKIAGVGAVLFFPALLFIDGDGPEATEYAQLKGQHKAIEEEANRRNCNMQFHDEES